MTRATHALAVSVALALLLVWGSACGGDETSGPTTETTAGTVALETESGTQAIESDDDSGTFFFETEQGEGQLSFDLDGDGVVTEGDGGSFQLTPGLPAGWPGDFPLPDGTINRGGNVVEAGSLRQLTAVFDVAQAPGDLLAFYEQSLSDHTAYTDLRNPDPAAYDASFSFDGTWVGFVLVQPGPQGSTLAVQLHQES